MADEAPVAGALFDYVAIVVLSDEGKPVLESVYPDTKRDETRGILHFCWPEGKAALESTLASTRSENFSFVLTESDGSKRFGYCRRFLRTQPPECFCAVTKLPSVALFQELLNIVEIRRSQSPASSAAFLAACLEAGCPAPGHALTVRVPALSGKDGAMDEHHLKRPEVNEILLDYVTFFTLFSCVSIKNIVHLFSNALLERRIILVAENLATLSSCVMAASNLLQPFHWQHVYIPVLPLVLIDYCLADDHQILTSDGFLFRDEYERRLRDERRAPLLVASYAAATGHLVYERPSRFIVNAPGPEPQPMVELSHGDAGVSLLVTPEHDLYAAADSGGSSACYRKVPAGVLAHALSPWGAFRMLARARAGVRHGSGVDPLALPVAAALGLCCVEHVVACLELFGFWLRNGARCDADGSLRLFVGGDGGVYNDASNLAWARERLHALGLIGTLNGDWLAVVGRRDWAALFGDARHEWLWALDAPLLHHVVAGLARGRICVASTALRDDAVRLLLHAGFSAQFHACPPCKWFVSFTEHDAQAAPLLQRDRDVRVVQGYNGPTWCVTVPSGLIVARRAQRSGTTVAAASRPVIVGNCTAPMPFFVGVLKSCLPVLESMPLEEVLVLDVEGDRFIRDPMFEDALPKADEKRLIKTLKAIQLTPERESDLQIASSFYQFFFDLFAGFDAFYEMRDLPPQRGADPNAPVRQGLRFDMPRWLATKSPPVRAFMEQFQQAQILQTFLQENEQPEHRYKFVNQAEYIQHLQVSSDSEMADAMRSMGRALGSAWQGMKEAAAKKRAQKKLEENSGEGGNSAGKKKTVPFGTLKKNPHDAPVRVPASENIDLILAKDQKQRMVESSPSLARRAPTHRPCVACHIYIDLSFSICPHCQKQQPSPSQPAPPPTAGVLPISPMVRRPPAPGHGPSSYLDAATGGPVNADVAPPPLLDDKYKRPPPPPPKGMPAKRAATKMRPPPPPPVPHKNGGGTTPTSASLPDISTLHIHMTLPEDDGGAIYTSEPDPYALFREHGDGVDEQYLPRDSDVDTGDVPQSDDAADAEADAVAAAVAMWDPDAPVETEVADDADGDSAALDPSPARVTRPTNTASNSSNFPRRAQTLRGPRDTHRRAQSGFVHPTATDDSLDSDSPSMTHSAGASQAGSAGRSPHPAGIAAKQRSGDLRAATSGGSASSLPKWETGRSSFGTTRRSDSPSPSPTKGASAIMTAERFSGTPVASPKVGRLADGNTASPQVKRRHDTMWIRGGSGTGPDDAAKAAVAAVENDERVRPLPPLVVRAQGDDSATASPNAPHKRDSGAAKVTRRSSEANLRVGAIGSTTAPPSHPPPLRMELVKTEVLVASTGVLDKVSPRRPAPPPPGSRSATASPMVDRAAALPTPASPGGSVNASPAKTLVKIKVKVEKPGPLPCCVYCGERAERIDARFCVACGKEISGVSSTRAPTTPPKRPNASPAVVRVGTDVINGAPKRGSGRFKLCDGCQAENESIAPQCVKCRAWF